MHLTRDCTYSRKAQRVAQLLADAGADSNDGHKKDDNCTKPEDA